ncbi:MAG: AI-2E family transporter [Gloeobacteraceae cyanobacterium ES-bin-316]|nr:AI-2E family transporter [Ferruginibacter sp.]
MNTIFNDRLRQLILLILIVLLGYMLFSSLYIFLPGLLGGITLYILGRGLYFRLIYKRKWKKGGTALLFILVSLVIISIPIYISVALVSPKINEMVQNQDKILESIKVFSTKISDFTGIKILTAENTKALSLKITSFIPKILNSTANIATNLIMMFFLLYYLLVNGKGIEQYLNQIIPLKRQNVNKLASETKMMIRANALGIPIICIVQGIFATLGYWIFGVEDWGLWGFVTGVFAFFPLVGTMVVWVPMVLYMLASGITWPAIGLGIFSLVVTGNVDYITRLGLLKRMGNVHPMITVLGVIVGLNLFGFMGLIFGPLLVSYFIILVKIYFNEFALASFPNEPETAPQNQELLREENNI